jgi:hypothetical protein
MADPGEWAEIDWDGLYLSARSWGVQPSEFWGMTFAEWFCEADHHRGNQPGEYAGKLTRAAVDEIRADLELSDEEWRARHGLA